MSTEIYLHEEVICPTLAQLLLNLSALEDGAPVTLAEIYGLEDAEDICNCCWEKVERTVETLARLQLIPLIPLESKEQKGPTRYIVCADALVTALDTMLSGRESE